MSVMEGGEVYVLKDLFCYRGGKCDDGWESGFVGSLGEIDVFHGDGGIGGGDVRFKFSLKVTKCARYLRSVDD